MSCKSSFSREAHQLHGGCRCGAVRYTVNVPKWEDRPSAIPWAISDQSWEDGQARHPWVVMCHCDQCRRSSAGLVLAAMTVPLAYGSFDLLLQTPNPPTIDSPPVGERITLGTIEACSPNPTSTKTYLHHYESTKDRWRGFCANCGTNVTYLCHPLPPGMIPVYDLLLTTLDREYLDGTRASIRPERTINCDTSIGWIKDLLWEGDRSLFEGGACAPSHGTVDVTKYVRGR